MSAGTYLRSTVGHWRLVDFLGAGGMGEVYRAVHLETGRVGALKVLTASGRSTSFVERFRNEARILSSLQHRHIAAWYETLETDGQPCFVMEYVTGDTLEQRLRQGAIPTPAALAWFADLCDAVAYIHARGVVHRDLKANNVKIDEQGTLKLLDFGIAKAGDSPKLTTDGSVVGTLSYLSPEQVHGEPATPASDVWALGVLLYEMLTGQVPFAGASFTAVMARILKGAYQAPSLITAGIPRDVERLIARCLRVDPRDRYPTAAAVLTDVRALLQPAGIGPTRTPRFRWPLAASMAATLLAGGYLWWSSQTCCAPPPVADCCPPPPVQPPADSLKPDSNLSSARRRPVMIRVFEGSAEVVRNGRVIGRTPMALEATVGEWIAVTLRQPGFDDLSQRFQVSDGPNEFHYTMQRAAAPALPPRDEPEASASPSLPGIS